MSPPYYVRPLTAEKRREQDQLCTQPPNARVYQRALAVLLSSEGKTTHQIGRVVRRDHSTVFRQRDRVRVIWNACYAPNLNLLERYGENLKRSALHSDFFETVANLEQAILDAVLSINKNRITHFD